MNLNHARLQFRHFGRLTSSLILSPRFVVNNGTSRRKGCLPA